MNNINSDKKRRLLELIDEIEITDKDIETSYQHYCNLKKDYEMEFERKTKLNDLDVKILFLGIFLQIARQFFISNDSFRFKKDSDGDKIPKQLSKKVSSKLNNDKYIKILTGPVPYDAFRYLDKEDFKFNYGSHRISGVNHRYTTLGHDPILGWIFGTMNIITGTLTKKNLTLDSYTVINDRINQPILITEVFEQFVEEIEKDNLILGVAILKQALHFSSDCFTKMGLPIPIINNISPELTKILKKYEILKNPEILKKHDLDYYLTKGNIDLYSVSRGILLTNIINYIIGIIHKIYYDNSIPEELYNIKTKKVILYSNIISSTSNIIYTSITKDLKKLDIGGFIVTLFNLYKSQKFIRKVKEEYINSKLDEHYKKELEKLDNELDELLNKILK